MSNDNDPYRRRVISWSVTQQAEFCLKALAASVPGAASFLQAWSDWEAHRLKGRVDDFFAELRLLIQGHERRLATVEAYIRSSAEFADLLEKTLRNISAETSSNKRKITTVAFLGAILAGPSLSTDEKNNLLDSLDTLTVSEIDRLRQFADGYPISLSQFLYQPVNPMANPDEQAEPAGKLAIEIAKLQGRGLIAETVRGATSWSGDNNHWVNRLRVKSYVVLPAGRALLALLNNG